MTIAVVSDFFFFLIMGAVFLLLCVLGNFWMPDTVFYFVGCCIFLSTYKSWALFWEAVNLFGNNLIFWSWAFRIFLEGLWIWGGAQSRVNCSPLARQDLEYFTHCPKLWVFLVWPLGTGSVTSLLCMTATIPLNPFGWIFPWPWVVFLNIHVLLYLCAVILSYEL